MNYYIDIRIKAAVEMRENFLLNKVYTKFHKVLHTLNASDIGVSFPEYNLKLGCVIRIHALEERLKTLQETNWLGGLVGYCEISLIQPIPEMANYRTVSRI